MAALYIFYQYAILLSCKTHTIDQIPYLMIGNFLLLLLKYEFLFTFLMMVKNISNGKKTLMLDVEREKRCVIWDNIQMTLSYIETQFSVKQRRLSVFSRYHIQCTADTIHITYIYYNSMYALYIIHMRYSFASKWSKYMCVNYNKLSSHQLSYQRKA